MGAPVTVTKNWHAENYDMVIDVRSPGEFYQDHIIGAVNLPVLSNTERSQVGTLYKQTSPFAARKVGAALISQNIARHLQGPLKDLPPDFSPLVHCWRGGQRSQAFAHILAEIGWRCCILEGGYKAYRRDVITCLDKTFSEMSFIIIAGRTGSAKTDLLYSLKKQQAQILDLEGLAHHRGSLLGQIPGKPQPSQRLFESALADEIRKFDPNLPIFVESESSRIGQVQIPKTIWHKMTQSPVVIIDMPAKARADYLLSVYDHLLADTSDLTRLIEGMRHRHGHEITQNWQALMDNGEWHALAILLLEEHYDPAYDRSAHRHQRPILAEIHQKDGISQTLDRTAAQILEQMKTHRNKA